MISSAVVIPDESEASLLPTSHEQTTSLKRRQSEISESPDSSKRPRLDTHSSTIANNYNGATSPSSPRAARNASSPTTTTSAVAVGGGLAMSPPRRRPTANSDEKSRNRRLFGALLGNLAQPAASSRTKSSTTSATATATARRREDIESRQRQRLQRESEEISAHARRKREELNRTRKVEQRRWDEEGMRIRHANMRAMAGFLRTETEPLLYYKPWEMRAQEEETVKRQRDEVEETISRECQAWERKKRQQQDQEEQEEGERGDSGVGVRSGNTNGTVDSRRRRGESSDDVPMNGDGGVDGPADALPQARDRGLSPSSTREDEKDALPSPARSRTEANRASGPGSDRPQSSRDDDHGGEELELGQEDDVIY